MKSSNIVNNQHIKQLYFPIKKTALWDWRDASAVHSSGYSSRGCTWQLKTVCNSVSQRLTPSSSLCCTRYTWAQTHMQTQCPYKRNEKQDKQTNLFFKIVPKNKCALRNSFHSLDFLKHCSYLMNILIEILDIFRIRCKLLTKKKIYECFKGSYG